MNLHTILENKHTRSVLSVLIPLMILSIIPFEPENEATEVVTEDVVAIEVIEKKNLFSELELDATSVYVLDTVTGEVLFQKNPDVQLPLASVTKLMTAYVADSYLQESDPITISSDDLLKEGDSGLFVNESWVTQDLLDFTLMVSSNDGASALASAVNAIASTITPASTSTVQELEPKTDNAFVDEMNKAAQDIGLSTTFFANESGLDISKNQSGAYGSAKDMALLISHIYKTNPNLLSATTYEQQSFVSIDELAHGATNTNSVLHKLPNVLASKTGYTELAGGNLVVLIDAGIEHPIAIAVLGSGYDTRFDDVIKLAWTSIETLVQ